MPVSDNVAMTTDREKPAGRAVRVERFATAADADAHDRAYWMRLPTAERIQLVWRLSQEQWRLSGSPADESGLCRSVASIRRR